MELLLNISTAWITVALMVLLLVIYVFRKWIVGSKLPKTHWARRWNQKLRKPHKWMGLAAVVTGLVHGLYSSVKVVSPNKGTILWLLLLVLGITWMFRKKLSKFQPWMKIHRLLAGATIIFLVLHVLEVGGFVGVEPLVSAVKHELQGFDEEALEVDETDQGAGLKEEVDTADDEPKISADEELIELTTIPDGRYRGQAVGYQPGLVVEVEIAGGAITEVVVVQHNEVKRQYWGRPVAEIPLAIVEGQSTEVDIVSGATFTSMGIMAAVDDALANALKGEKIEVNEVPDSVSEETSEASVTEISDESHTEATSDTQKEGLEAQDEEATGGVIIEEVPESPEKAEPETEAPIEESGAPDAEAQTSDEVVTEPSVNEADKEDENPKETTDANLNDTEDEGLVIAEEPSLKDGTYTGAARGYDGEIVVEVTIKNGGIAVVKILSHEERDPYYYSRPVTFLPGWILQAGSTEVDVVSGSTITSEGIINAVEDALSKAR